ncbi:hypothetical protein [Streptomyces sp. NPDC055992]|uniref:hypothetical protein n=1 Tax=Streptomyces sp. NPDC055992 TaxID=3345673 RepID=UPI0035E2D89C
MLPETADAAIPAPTVEFVDYYKTPPGMHPRSTGDMTYAARISSTSSTPSPTWPGSRPVHCS